MGILVSIGKAAEIAKTSLEVAEKLSSFTPTRAVVVQVHNHTDATLRLHSHDHYRGTFGEPPSQRIPPKHVDIYGSRRRRNRPTGAIGEVTYRIENHDARGTVEWRNRLNPFRKNATSARLSGGDAHEFEITDIVGGGSTAEARYELFERNGQIIVEGPGGGGSGGGSTGGPVGGNGGGGHQQMH